MKENILLVDDEETLRSSLSLRLRGEGYIVDTAADATEGLRKATSLPFDLIILRSDAPRPQWIGCVQGHSRSWHREWP